MIGPQERQNKVPIMLEIKFCIVKAKNQNLTQPSLLGCFRITLIQEYRYTLITTIKITFGKVINY